jgi:GT2 family glycosyltransferase
LFALVVNWEGAAATCAAVASLLSGSVRPERIVVVDNGSRDSSSADLQSLARKVPSVALVLAERNEGYGWAINTAAAYALQHGARFLIGMNNDVTVAPDCLEHLLHDRSASAITCPVILRGKGAGQPTWWAGGRLIKPWLRVAHDSSSMEVISTRARTSSSDFATGAIFLMTAEAWLDLGGFDEDYFLYWEDIDLSARARAMGIQPECANRALAWHSVSASTNATSKFGSVTSLYFDYRNRWLFHAKIKSSQQERILSCAFAALRLGRMAVQLGFRDTDARRLLGAALRGMVAGIRSDFTRRHPL